MFSLTWKKTSFEETKKVCKTNKIHSSCIENIVLVLINRIYLTNTG